MSDFEKSSSGKKSNLEAQKRFYEECEGRGYYPLKPYINSREKILLLCSKGHRWETPAGNFVIKKRNCPVCNNNQKIIKGKERWELFIKNSKFVALSDYINSRTLVLVKCTFCDKESWRIPNHLYRGYRDCSRCRRSDNNTAAENFYKKLITNNVIVLDEYINNYKKIRVKHRTCKSTYEIIPKKYMNGSFNDSNCPYCFRFVRDVLNQVKKGQLEVEVAIKFIEEKGWSTRLDDLRRYLLNGCATNN